MSKTMTPRQLRRMEARRLRKRAAKEEKQSEALASGAPDPAIVSRLSETARLRKQDRKTEVNRENAQHSTGPRSIAGKAASSRNAVRHGLTGTFCVLPGEDGDAYLLLHTELLCEHDPVTATEELLVSDMVRHYWLTQRAMRLQEEVLSRDLNDPLVMKQLALFIRYQTTNQRAFHKCLADLQKLQKQRKQKELEELGFVSQIEEATRATASGASSYDSPNGFVSQNEPSTNQGSSKAGVYLR